ncbi:50S ribosomal protein L7/L12 [Mycoplasma phocimorsus]|uniref:Large ribosomal subunit protein bL12 n=1 Tax=Mycoplasma phocimorsus TaxID=3045839 RepID=A0AAJ1UZA2_9MOLU|nr:50S ribosomal protein L7/L12 [Mycoplasma phocimorsus]MDJ1645523.1 50S ribosomal protein L7/L12 [Mycoplasma phocimorsus]MDJ1646217.1 50S ribosomal protein L7/L12 [Mycoplasma phocimorsus]MDJ1646815.1 50S ribosomal protein L7/L12 [Mycoplasma phocimorsus]MDJ1648203.1 50S ribosomal protein L7/L12 [Mycoplasma phocimorsus]MDJ1648654.1 50S ribosomal protein L7/L12 [Mycoplasma phocimorsus]
MAKLTKESFIESLKEMSIKEVMELVEAMKEEFGIDPSAVAVAAGSVSGEEAEEKTSVKLVLKSDGGAKIPTLKAIKEAMGLSLMDAKKLVEAVPATLLENVKPEEAEAMKAKILEASPTAELEVE